MERSKYKHSLSYNPISYSKNYGFLLDKLPIEVYNGLTPYIEEIKSDFSSQNPWNGYLAGDIKHEYEFTTYPLSFLEFLKESIDIFLYESQYLTLYQGGWIPSSPYILEMDNMWINFQRKYEFNPLHKHTGLISWVLWYDIPYIMEEEDNFTKNFNDNSSVPARGRFAFVHPDIGGDGGVGTTYLPADKNWNGSLAIFPSSLNHIVYPFFSSDKFRITLSANVLIHNKL